MLDPVLVALTQGVFPVYSLLASCCRSEYSDASRVKLWLKMLFQLNLRIEKKMGSRIVYIRHGLNL